MEREPNLVIPSASQRIIEDGVPFKVDIYKLEGGDGWSLEVATEDGTSIVWDKLFDDDQAAFEEAVTTIRSSHLPGASRKKLFSTGVHKDTSITSKPTYY